MHLQGLAENDLKERVRKQRAQSVFYSWLLEAPYSFISLGSWCCGKIGSAE